VSRCAAIFRATSARADLLRFEGADLLVGGADQDALLVVQHRAVDGAGDVVEREFGFAARVDDGVEFVEPRQDVVEAQDSGVFHYCLIRGASCGQMLEDDGMGVRPADAGGRLEQLVGTGHALAA
jgi:hypothetical protein